MPEKETIVPEELTPELVRKLAEEVYRILRREAQLEYERIRGRGARPTYKRRIR
jgi:hypothetical protein